MPKFRKMGIGSNSSSRRRRSKGITRRNHVTWISDVATFVPSDLDTLSLWLKADAGITKGEDDRVSDWASQVGSYSVVQTRGSNQPLYVASQINSLPVIRFLTDDILEKTSSVFSGDSSVPMTVAAVLKIKAAAAAGTDTQYAFSTGSGENALAWTGKGDSSLATFKLASTKLDPTSVTGPDVAVDTTKFLMWEVFPDGTGSLWVDKVKVTTADSLVADGTLHATATIGGGGSLAPDMDLGELCVWQGNIEGPTIQNFFNYIKSRWGV